jgi:myo-inositol-1(or 4)-monophosphatase
MAAGIVLVREAGGVVSDFSGGATMLESSQVLATNATLQKGLLALVRPGSGRA